MLFWQTTMTGCYFKVYFHTSRDLHISAKKLVNGSLGLSSCQNSREIAKVSGFFAVFKLRTHHLPHTTGVIEFSPLSACTVLGRLQASKHQHLLGFWVHGYFFKGSKVLFLYTRIVIFVFTSWYKVGQQREIIYGGGSKQDRRVGLMFLRSKNQPHPEKKFPN